LMVLKGFEADPSLLLLPFTETWYSLAETKDAINTNKNNIANTFLIFNIIYVFLILL